MNVNAYRTITLLLALVAAHCGQGDERGSTVDDASLKGSQAGDVRDSTAAAPYLALLTVDRRLQATVVQPIQEKLAVGFWIAPRVLVTSCSALDLALEITVKRFKQKRIWGVGAEYESWTIIANRTDGIGTSISASKTYSDSGSVACIRNEKINGVTAATQESSNANKAEEANSDIAVVLLDESAPRPSLKPTDYPEIQEGDAFEDKSPLLLFGRETWRERALVSKPVVAAQATGSVMYVLSNTTGVQTSPWDFGAPVIKVSPENCSPAGRPQVVGMIGRYRAGSAVGVKEEKVTTIHRIDHAGPTVRKWLQEQIVAHGGPASDTSP